MSLFFTLPFHLLSFETVSYISHDATWKNDSEQIRRCVVVTGFKSLTVKTFEKSNKKI